MADLDLDAIEYQWRMAGDEPGTTGATIHALIQRLREAEAEIQRLQQTLRYYDPLPWEAPDPVRLRSSAKFEALERVREAAVVFIQLVDEINRRPRKEGIEMRVVGAQGNLRAALDNSGLSE